MGRRKQYTRTALIRLTEDEHSRLTTQARTLKLSLSRFLVHAGLTGKMLTCEDRERHERAIVEVKRIGNNLNQIARQLNSHSGTIKFARVEQVLRETKTAVENIGAFSSRAQSGRR